MAIGEIPRIDNLGANMAATASYYARIARGLKEGGGDGSVKPATR